MEQIHKGTISMKQFSVGAHVRGSKIDFNARREEPIFDALMGQKKDQCGSDDVVAEKSRKPEETRENAAPEREEVENTEKPVAGKEEEETCDVAREVAAAQIVWLTQPNAAHLKAPEQMQNAATIERPMIFATNDEPVKPLEGLMEDRLAEMTGEIQTVVQNEQASVEITEQFQLETNINPRSDEMVFETHMTDSDETGGEAVEMQMPLFDEVEAAPIKVAEAPERTEQSVPVEQQVTTKLVNLLENGETRVQIQLEPVELGKLTIELTRSEDGTLSILLDAEKAQTRGLLEKHMGNLQEALTDRGQKVAQITVERGEEAQRQDNQQRDDFYDGRNGQQQQQQEQQRRDDRRDGLDFLQQLRLGLIPLEDEEDK